MLLLSSLLTAAAAFAEQSCKLSPACLTGVASTIGYFQNNPAGRAHLQCSQIWAKAVSSNSGPRSVHHRCPASAGVGGPVAFLSPVWRECAAAVISAGKTLNVSVCAYQPRLIELHSLHSDMAVLQSGRPCFTGIGGESIQLCSLWGYILLAGVCHRRRRCFCCC